MDGMVAVQFGNMALEYEDSREAYRLVDKSMGDASIVLGAEDIGNLLLCIKAMGLLPPEADQ